MGKIRLGVLAGIVVLLTVGAASAALPDNGADWDDDWPCPVDDMDCDGWINPAETWGWETDSLDPCSIPPDVSRDGWVNILDVILFGPWMNIAAPADATVFRHFDMDTSGAVNIIDVVILGPYYNEAVCG